MPPRVAGAAPLHILHVFSTFSVGGAQTRLVTLANALLRRYRHTVLAMDGNVEAGAGFGPDLACGFATIPVVKTRFVSIANIVAARALLRRLGPDLLVTYNWGAIEWALAVWPGLCPHIHIEDGFGPEETPQRQLWRRAFMRRVLLSRCARVIVPSTTLLAVATQRWHLKPALVLYLPNGIDCARFAHAPDPALVASLAIPADAPVIGTVAGLRPEKNVMRLVRVFAALPRELGARLVIVGDGSERGAIADAAKRLGVADRVVMAGALARPELILGRFDVFALTSDTEQMPNSVLEAMAASGPVVATDVGDVRMILAAENASYVVPAADETALTAKLAALLRDPDLRRRIGRANRDHVRQHYGLESMVVRYDALFSSKGRAP